ncbi:hypothetical protein C2E23DRAFT_10556 [Lenzites betulinus]|nr:hypothetical protein C2E23DRAFT_10556 [Lenzites betulinus]
MWSNDTLRIDDCRMARTTWMFALQPEVPTRGRCLLVIHQCFSTILWQYCLHCLVSPFRTSQNAASASCYPLPTRPGHSPKQFYRCAEVGRLNVSSKTRTTLPSMANSAVPLPVEVYEQIIDSTATGLPLWTSQEEYETFKNCALVCRAWLPRSRWNLFLSIHIIRASQVDRLLSVYSSNPSLLDLVQYVHVGAFDTDTWPTDGVSARDPYIPFANGRLTQALRNARVFRLTGLTWFNYPPVYTSLFGQFKNLIDLQLNSIHFGSAADVVRMAWNCPALEALAIQYCRFSHVTSEADATRLQGARRTKACRHLQRIDLEDWQDSNFTPPLLALGDTVKTLFLNFNSAKPWRVGGRVLDIVSHYRALESLHLTMVFTWDESQHTLSHEIPGYEREAPLLAFLAYIQPDHLKKLELSLQPVFALRDHAPPDDGWTEDMDVPVRTYTISRSQMIEKVIGRDIMNILDPKRFLNLEELIFNIEDDVHVCDVDWWWERVNKVLPSWPKRLGFSIDLAPFVEAHSSELWLAEDATPSA